MDPNQLPPQQPPQPQNPQQPVQQFQGAHQEPQAQPYQQPLNTYPQNIPQQQPYQQPTYQQPLQNQYPQQQSAATPQQASQASYEAYQDVLASEEAALKPPKWPIILGGVGLVIGLGVLGFIVFGGGDEGTSQGIDVIDIENQEQTEEAHSQEQETNDEPTQSKTIPINKSVKLRAASLNFDLTFVEAIRGAKSTNSFRAPDDGFENVLVKLKVKNNGGVARSFFASNINAQTKNGELFPKNSGYSEFNQEDDWPSYAPAYDANDRIEPGETGEGYILFVLPSSAQSVTAVVDWSVNVIGGDDVSETYKVGLY